MSARHLSAFTLIELMVVIGILAMLTAMLMPMTAVIRQGMLRSSTLTVMKKVDTGLRLFKADFGIYPYQAGYADLDGGETLDDHPNNLGYRLGTVIGAAARAKVEADMLTAAGRFSYSVNPANSAADGIVGAPGLTYVAGDPGVGSTQVATMLNRLAREQVRIAVLSGNLAMRGPVICTATGALAANKTSINVMTSSAQSGTRLGWTADYLGHDLEARYLRDDTVLDAWGTPLVYVCQVVPGMKINGGSPQTSHLDNRRFGLGAIGFDPRTGPAPAQIAGGRPLLLNYGRIRLGAANGSDGLQAPADAAYLPDPDAPLHSDRRYYAAPGFEMEFELWSAGRDRRFAWMRDAPVNRDNPSLVPYDKGLIGE